MVARPLLLATLLLTAFAPHAPRPDFAGLYRPGPRLELDARREADSLRVYLRVPAANGLGTIQRPLRVALWKSYDERIPEWEDSVPRRRWRVQSHADGSQSLNFCLAMRALPAGSLLQFSSRPLEEYQEAATTAWLPLTAEVLARPFVLTDSVGQPLLRPYVRAGEIVGIDTYGLEQPVTGAQYDLQPTAALPPMTDPRTVPSGPPTLPVLDSARVPAGRLPRLRLARPGLYALRVGGAGGVARRTVAVLAEDHSYPALTTAAELIEPLRYLTTSQERRRLLAAPSAKRAVDDFWLDIAKGNKELGKDLIRRYYGRVATANELFAAHKAGWLTDMGLLYVVLGPPSSVRRLGDGEERWFYPEGDRGQPVTFTFRPKPSTFAPHYYELVRRPEYELLWYAAVEQWRTPTTAPSAGPANR